MDAFEAKWKELWNEAKEANDYDALAELQAIKLRNTINTALKDLEAP